MRLEEKISKYRKLKRDPYPSDQEIEEMQILEEEIKSELSDSLGIKNAPVDEPQKQNNKKKYRGVISGRILKWRDERKEKNKATPEKIEQLKLEYQKAKLEAGIAEEKGKKKKTQWEKMEKLLSSGGMTDKDRDKERDEWWKKMNNYKW